MLIDLSSWYKDSLAPKIEMIQTAIEQRHLISFRYYAPKGDSDREIEPYFLIFKWTSWYVWGWCREKEDFRLFKLNRMDALRICNTAYEVREAPLPDLSSEKIFPGGVQVKALFQPQMRWRLVEEFGPDCFEEQSDRTLLFCGDYSDEESLIDWMLTFRDQVEVLEPESVRRELMGIAERVTELYKQ